MHENKADRLIYIQPCRCIFCCYSHYFIRLSGHISYHNSIMFCGVKQLCLGHSVLCFYTLWEKHYGIKSEHCKTCSQWIMSMLMLSHWILAIKSPLVSSISTLKYFKITPLMLLLVSSAPLTWYRLLVKNHEIQNRSKFCTGGKSDFFWSQMSCILKADFSTCNRELKLEFKLHSDDSFLGISQLAYPCVFTRHWQTAANQAF